MAYTGTPAPLDTAEQMGAFSGYIRRPQPNASGMIAQIFGENGDDADTILALSLSKYQDAQVFVNIYLIKDAVGRIMKEGDKYPLISSFVGFVRRSMPKKDGMVAQFFAPNGEHADSIASLSKSDYQDCLVFVDVRGSKALANADAINQENIQQINNNYVDRITKNERAEFARKEKSLRKMNEILELSDFLTKIEVVTSIGSPDEFTQWLDKSQTCAHLQEKPCMHASHHTKVVGLLRPFNFLPVCTEHETQLQDDEHLSENRFYYEMRHRLLLKQWVWTKFKERFSYDGKSEPDPARVLEWAVTKNLSKYIPEKYKPLID